MRRRELPLPPHFDPKKVDTVWKVSYQERAREAEEWAKKHRIPPAALDRFKIALLAIDVQNAFCIPGFELFVAGRSGSGAVEDNQRLCAFLYRNLDVITRIVVTLDTHQAVQIFHSLFWISETGEHPEPFTLISEEDITSGRWTFNPALSSSLGLDERYVARYLRHYARRLKEGGKYQLTIWPYHVMLGSIGHALVSAVEEAIFFHSIARHSQPNFLLKGNNPLTEHYSVLGPEVLDGPDGDQIAERNRRVIEQLMQFDAIIIAGQAKSHCVAWTVEDLLKEITIRDPKVAANFYLLEDCTSPVVVPGVMDYTDEADAAFRRFADAGMHIVRSTEPLARWPGIEL